MADMNEVSDAMDDDQLPDDEMQQHSHWTTKSTYKLHIVSMEKMTSAKLEEIVQNNMCMMGLNITHSNTKHQKKQNVLCLGATCKTVNEDQSDYKNNLSDLYIRNPLGVNSNNFNNMGLSYNALKTLKTEDQNNMYANSEMFGAGIFNDNVRYNNTLHSGFSGICTDVKNTMKKTNGVLFTNYIIAAMFNLLVRLDTSPNGVFAIQDSIREGNGMAWVDLVEFHPLFPGDILLSESKIQSWFENISARMKNISDNIDDNSSFHDMIKKHKTGPFSHKSNFDKIDGSIMKLFYTSDEVKFNNIALCVYKYMNDFKMNLHKAPPDVEHTFV